MTLNHNIPQLKQKLATARVLVVGDVMLDRYWFGDVSRISPEAPVPVAKIGKVDQRAGGAANVARNIASLGGQAALLSVTGADEAGPEIRSPLVLGPRDVRARHGCRRLSAVPSMVRRCTSTVRIRRGHEGTTHARVQRRAPRVHDDESP